MSAQPESTAPANSTHDGLFDDDEATLSGICFDHDVRHAATFERGCTASSWCKSSSSSCCSLCRPPAVSEADDDSNARGIPNDAGLQLGPGGAGQETLVPLGSFDRRFLNDASFRLGPGGAGQEAFGRSKDLHSAICACNHTTTPNYRGSFCRHSRAPVKSISIPRSCFHSISAKLDQEVASRDSCDYLSSRFFPGDALFHMVKYLDVPSLLRVRECSRELCQAASNNSAGWREHCNRLWSSKANVCSLARATLAETNEAFTSRHTAMEAYKISVIDAATRREVSLDEICFDGSPNQAGTIWSFRFKESAGQDWTSWDPWWNKQRARKLVFLRDGTIKQLHPPGLEATSRDLNDSRLYDVFSERTVRRDGADVPAARIEMKWRFVRRPLDLPARPEGAYVRVTVGGRDVPTYVARRSPNGNWGFVLESCWGVYASFEMASRVVAAPYDLRWGRRRLRRRRNGGSQWVNVEDSDSDGGDDDGAWERERTRNVRRRIDLFVEESAMTQDGQSQWREALLYNIGAVTLPEGNCDPKKEFDRAWQRAMMII